MKLEEAEDDLAVTALSERGAFYLCLFAFIVLIAIGIWLMEWVFPN